MPILSHRRFRSDVHRLIDGELPVERVHALGAHLDACARCRGDLGWWLSIRRSLCRDRIAMSRHDGHEPDRSPGPLTRFAGPVGSAAIAAIWALLTLWRPTATFHFAPLLVTVAWPYAARVQHGRAAGWAEAAPAVLGGAAVSLLTTALLTVAGRLDGPTFWDSSGAPLEAVALTLLGAAWGARVLVRRRGGLLSTEIESAAIAVERSPSEEPTP